MLLFRSSDPPEQECRTAIMAVQEVIDRDLEKSSFLSSMMMPDVITPQEVVKLLNSAKIRFVLVGAYGLARWLKEARATEDVDVVVLARHVKKAVSLLLTKYPQLEAVDLPVVTRLRERETHNVVVDVMKPMQQPYRDALKHTKTASIGSHSCRIPSLEMALVMKFAAMTSLYRATKDRYQDAHDFILIVENNSNDIDRLQLAELAQLIYPEAGKDINKLVDRALAGETIIL
jgi:hypothetical protein